MFLLVVAVFAFTVFAFVVIAGRGAASDRRGYREHRLGDYSGWLQAWVAAPETWRRVESCLSQARVCGGQPFDGAVGRDAMEFYKQHLSPIQVHSDQSRSETIVNAREFDTCSRCSLVAASRRRGAGSGT
jgi:hypothetical protein